jgi:hypothetical protein
MALEQFSTIKEYEAHAGLNFERRRAQAYTQRHLEPPNPDAGADWASHIHRWYVRVELDRRSIPPSAFDDPVFWYLGFHDRDERELFRKDLSVSEIHIAANERQRITIERTFESERQPATWTVWPKSRSSGWLRKIKGSIEPASRVLLD